MEAKQIADVAEAARVYLERTHASAETVNRAAEIRTLAERQMGEFLRAMPKATGAAGHAGPGRGNAVPMENRVSDAATLAEIGITKNESSRAQKLADIPKEEFAERIAVAKASGEVPTPAKILRFEPAASSPRTPFKMSSMFGAAKLPRFA